MPDDLHHVGAAPAKDKQVAGVRLCGAPHNQFYVSNEDMWRLRPGACDSAASVSFAAT
jgi:hypothetical protein